jgi:hypothetical protein
VGFFLNREASKKQFWSARKAYIQMAVICAAMILWIVVPQG